MGSCQIGQAARASRMASPLAARRIRVSRGGLRHQPRADSMADSVGRVAVDRACSARVLLACSAAPLVDVGPWLYAARFTVGTRRGVRTLVECVREHLRHGCTWRLCGCFGYPTLDLVGRAGSPDCSRGGVRVWPPQERKRSAVRPKRSAGN